MIDQVLMKFGLSEARRSIKNNPRFQGSAKKTSRSTTPRKKVRALEKSCEHNRGSPEQKNTLLRMIDYLRKCEERKCQLPGHDFHPIRFICLNEGCSNNLGCGHCFLSNHPRHPKAQINVCIRQLQDLNKLANDSYQKIWLNRVNLRDEIVAEIDRQIDNLCDEFHNNLQFLKNKAINQIDNYLLQHKKQQKDYFHPRKQNGEEMLLEIIRMDIRAIEIDLQNSIKSSQFEKMNVIPIVKVFQEMNSVMGHFMAEFKKSFPKLYPSLNFQDDTHQNPMKTYREEQELNSSISQSSSKRQQLIDFIFFMY